MYRLGLNVVTNWADNERLGEAQQVNTLFHIVVQSFWPVESGSATA